MTYNNQRMTKNKSENKPKLKRSKLSESSIPNSYIYFNRSCYIIEKFNIKAENKMDKVDAKIIPIQNIPRDSENRLKIEYKIDSTSYNKLNMIKDAVVKRKKIFL
jgi:hypothetical protein